MKKSRILSALTSVAMVGTMIASALPFTASAFDRLVVKESVSQFSLVPENHLSLWMRLRPETLKRLLLC